MNSSFVLELDTTPPVISIIAPNYTVANFDTEIIIESNEPLAKYQDIYVIDSSGARHELIFHYEGDTFVGNLSTNQLPTGISTVYARVKDEVFNQSDLVSKTIDLKPSARLFLQIRKAIRDLSTDKQTRKTVSKLEKLKLTTQNVERNISTLHSARKVEVREE